MNLNKVFVLGNLTRDPEERALPSGQSVVNFSLATNRFYTDSSGEKQQDSQFHNVVAFGKLADICSRYLKKGSLTLVEGRLRTRSWENSSGNRQYRTEIVAQNIQLPPKSWGPAATGNTPKKSQKKTKQEEIPVIEEDYNPSSKKKESKRKKTDQNEDEIDVEDIPF